MKGFEVWNKIQELPARAMNKLLKTMVNGPVKEVVEKVSELFRTFCKVASSSGAQALTAGTIGLALLSPLQVEAKKGCPIQNKIAGDQARDLVSSKLQSSLGLRSVGKEVRFTYIDPNNPNKRIVRVMDDVLENPNTGEFFSVESKNGYLTNNSTTRNQSNRDEYIINNQVSTVIVDDLGNEIEIKISKQIWIPSKSEKTGIFGISRPAYDKLTSKKLDVYALNPKTNEIEKVTDFEQVKKMNYAN